MSAIRRKIRYLRGGRVRSSVSPIKCNGESGFSVVELLVALTLMAFLSTSLLTIIGTGGGAFQKILDEKSAQSEARIAISYVTVKIRQYSSSGMVSVIPSDSPTNPGNVLKIDADAGMTGESYFIYFEYGIDGGAGRLVEKNAAAPRVGDPTGTQKIADISDFNITYVGEERNLLSISVGCDTPDGKITRDVSIALRS